MSARSEGSGAEEGPKVGSCSADRCVACGDGEVIEDPWLGTAVCQQCGHVAADSMLVEHPPYAASGNYPMGTVVTDAEVAEGFWTDRRVGAAGAETEVTVERLSARQQSAKVGRCSLP